VELYDFPTEKSITKNFIKNPSYLYASPKCDFGFSINSINSSIKRAKIAFNKLVTSMLVEGLNFSGWFINEKRDFVKLNTLYFNIFLSKEIEPSSLFR